MTAFIVGGQSFIVGGLNGVELTMLAEESPGRHSSGTHEPFKASSHLRALQNEELTFGREGVILESYFSDDKCKHSSEVGLL